VSLIAEQPAGCKPFDIADDFEPGVVPSLLWELVESHRRLLDDSIGCDETAAKLKSAAAELLHLKENTEPRLRQYIADELYNMGERGGLDADRIQAILAEAEELPVDAPPLAPSDAPSSRPVIRVQAGELHSIATKAEEALINAKAPLYARGGEIVRPIVEEVAAFKGRKTKLARLKPISTRQLARLPVSRGEMGEVRRPRQEGRSDRSAI
jgi:hypothetical protein